MRAWTSSRPAAHSCTSATRPSQRIRKRCYQPLPDPGSDTPSSAVAVLGELVFPLAVTVVAGSLLVTVIGATLLDAGSALFGRLLVVASTQFGAVATAEAQRAGSMTREFNVVRLLPIGAALLAI